MSHFSLVTVFFREWEKIFTHIPGLDHLSLITLTKKSEKWKSCESLIFLQTWTSLQILKCMENTTKKLYIYLEYHEKLYFLKYFYTGLSVQTTVCMIWKKYNWKYKLSAVLGTVIKCPKGTGSTCEKIQWKVVFFTSNIFAVLFYKVLWK